MFDPQKLLEQFLGGSGQPGGKPGLSPDLLKGLAGGSVAGSLATILLSGGSPKKMATTMLKVGGTAVVASLAYKAWNEWQASRGETQAQLPANPEGTPFLPAPKPERDAMSLALLGAMIAAAKADGHIDETEQKRIFAKLEEVNLDAAAKEFLAAELQKPLDIEAVVRAATTPELAVEIYTASRLAIDPDEPAEKAYLDMLAARLKLAPELRAAVEAAAAKALA